MAVRRRKTADSVALLAMLERAQASGGLVQEGPRRFRWDITTGCLDSYSIEWEAGGEPALFGLRRVPVTWVVIDCPCRRCAPCLRARAREWKARMRAEMAWASRSWMVTLTMRPDARHLMLSRARARYVAPDFDTRSLDEQARMLWAEFSLEITLYLKRVRKQSGAQLRMCVVAEQHADGFPHAHLILHERLGGGLATERILRRQWKWGFARASLTDVKAADYVAKYLTKTILARVRASVGYGAGFSGPAQRGPPSSVRGV